MDADRHYCACLSFSESVSVTLPRPDEDGDADETENAITQQSLMFSTKCLVLISRLDYFETFRVRFLNIIKSVHTFFLGKLIALIYIPQSVLKTEVHVFINICLEVSDISCE